VGWLPCWNMNGCGHVPYGKSSRHRVERVVPKKPLNQLSFDLKPKLVGTLHNVPATDTPFQVQYEHPKVSSTQATVGRGWRRWLQLQLT
jgi:hypothetical protein